MKRKTRNTFKSDVESYLASIGARPWPDGFYAFVLQTTIGELWITPYDDWIACRWANVADARAAGTNCNPFSGKWNFHCTAGTAAATLQYFQVALAAFLPEQVP